MFPFRFVYFFLFIVPAFWLAWHLVSIEKQMMTATIRFTEHLDIDQYNREMKKPLTEAKIIEQIMRQ